MGQCDQNGCTTVVTDADISASVALAKTVDTVIVNVAVTSTEGFDRYNLSLGEAQDALVTQVAAANPNSEYSNGRLAWPVTVVATLTVDRCCEQPSWSCAAPALC